MKVAQIAPLYERVPPLLYGGTERVVAYLTDALVEAGHDVTLFASGDSITKAKLVGHGDCALRLDRRSRDPVLNHLLLIEEALDRFREFDLLHFHVDYLHFPASARTDAVHLTTLHGRLDLPELQLMFRRFRRVPLVSISNAQRRPLEWANWIATVYHGLPLHLFRQQTAPGKYLAFIGRISEEKGVDRAIELARRVGIPLRIAAKIDTSDVEYFESKIKPQIDGRLIEFIGEIGEEDKQEFLGNACALAFLIDWPEPFGLAMIEAMACGTPVIAFCRGSVPEVIQHGENGFIVNSVDAAAESVKRIGTIHRAACRNIFERRFSAARMAEDYIAAYHRLLASRPSSPVAARADRVRSNAPPLVVEQREPD